MQGLLWVKETQVKNNFLYARYPCTEKVMAWTGLQALDPLLPFSSRNVQKIMQYCTFVVTEKVMAWTGLQTIQLNNKIKGRSRATRAATFYREITEKVMPLFTEKLLVTATFY